MVLGLGLFVMVSCARQGLPPGGPKDETPPAFARSVPAPLTKNVSVTEPVLIEFTEPMDKKSVADNLFIVPIPSQWPELKWQSGNSILMLVFLKPLRNTTTYVITIGSKASDIRSNQMKDSISLKFSTGETIENGEIRGKVIPVHFFDPKPENVSGVDVAAYTLSDSTVSPDPRNDVPDYVTQTNADGRFTLVGLSNGTYRLFAIGDKDRDGFYSEGYDMTGVSPHDVVLVKGDTLSFAPQIAISEVDTALVQLRSIRSPDRQRVEFFFDKDIDPQSVDISIEGLDIPGWFTLSGDLKRISAATTEQKNGKEYSIGKLQVKSADGFSLLPMEKNPFFTGTDRPDTTALEILEWGPKLLATGNDPVQMMFNRVLSVPENVNSVINDASGENLVVKKTGLNMLELLPSTSWKENFNYIVTFNRENLRGVGGNRLNGPGSQISFRVVPSDTLGIIEGMIIDKTGTPQSLYRLMFKNLDNDTKKTLEVKGQEKWTTGKVLPGRYVTAGFRDDNGDGVFTRGKAFPYRVSEPVYSYPDTITVVSRRTTGNINYLFQ
ncbi:MAG: Ig-like domain-containing protein [Candidatus Latescibacterota bacterium]